MNITFITTLKPFNDLFKPLQINAINSWYHLSTNDVDKQIIINTEFGDEVKEHFKDKLDKIIIQPLKRTAASGVPYVNDIFYSAYDHTDNNDILCYINSDIILLDDFFNSIGTVLCNPWYREEPYLMGGKRWNWSHGIEYRKLHDFSNKLGFLKYANDHIKKFGKYDVPWATDYFVHSRLLYKDVIPNDLILGRCVWDMWLLNNAITRKVNTFDLSKTSFIIHPKHVYAKANIRNIEQLKGSDKNIRQEFAANKRYKCPGSGKTSQFKFYTMYNPDKKIVVKAR